MRDVSRADARPEPVAVVRHQHRCAPAVLVSARPGQRRSSSLPLGAEDVGHGVEQGADLGVPVARALDRLGVQAERDVVDEHPAVDLGEVHPPLTAVDERVESADDVVAVHAEVEGEVVPGAGRHAGVRQPELGGDRGDDGLRAVPTRHREPVRATRDRAADKCSRSSPGFSSIGSMPRARACSASANRSPSRRRSED